MADPLPEIEQIRARHTKVKGARFPSHAVEEYCRRCRQDWPCDASLLLAALSEVEAELSSYVEGAAIWRRVCQERWDEIERLRVALSEAEAAKRERDHFYMEQESYRKALVYEKERAHAAEARLEALEGALRPFAELCDVAETMPERDDPAFADDYARLRAARAALAQEHTEPQEA